MIKAIIFDCFGVLTSDTWKEFVSTLKPEHVQQARALNHEYDAGKLTKPEFLNAVQQLTGRQPIYIDDMLDNETDKNFQLLQYITQLKNNYKIGLLSNIATNWIKDHFLNYQEQALFDDMVFSFEMGITKPNPDMFRIASQRLDVIPSETIMVDDIDHYCTAARSVGMKTVCYKDFTQFKSELEQILSHS